jgi:hypothetical protein
MTPVTYTKGAHLILNWMTNIQYDKHDQVCFQHATCSVSMKRFRGSMTMVIRHAWAATSFKLTTQCKVRRRRRGNRPIWLGPSWAHQAGSRKETEHRRPNPQLDRVDGGWPQRRRRRGRTPRRGNLTPPCCVQRRNYVLPRNAPRLEPAPSTHTSASRAPPPGVGIRRGFDLVQWCASSGLPHLNARCSRLLSGRAVCLLGSFDFSLFFITYL